MGPRIATPRAALWRSSVAWIDSRGSFWGGGSWGWVCEFGDEGGDVWS